MKNENDKALITKLVYKYGFIPEGAVALIERRRKTPEEIVKGACDKCVFSEWTEFRNS